MGTDWTGIAVVGQRVRYGDLYPTVRRRTFNHDHPETWKYDPETGRELWRDGCRDVLEGVDLGRLSVYVPLSGPSQAQMKDEFAFLGVGAETESNRSGNVGFSGTMAPLSTADLCEAKILVRQVLEPLGLWDEDQFGLWAVLGCSF